MLFRFSYKKSSKNMKTIRCPECNLVNWATATECKRCRCVLPIAAAAPVETASVGSFQSAQPSFQPVQSAFQSPPNSFQPAQNFPNNNVSHDFGFREKRYQQNSQPAGFGSVNNNYAPKNPYQSTYQPVNLKSGLAIASMVFGILGFVSSIFLIGLLLAPIGLILGIVALVKAKRRPMEYGGQGFAIAGVVTSALVVLIIPVIAAIAIPNILAAKRAANEGSAISTLRSISKAHTVGTNKPMKCSSLQEMASRQLINQGLSDGEHNGYKFAVNDFPAGGCEVTATPISSSEGNRSFYYSTLDGKIRGATKQGAVATNSDAIID